MSRLDDLKRFYEILDDLEQRIGGTRILGQCDGRMRWPRSGVYFFRESGEMRSNTGDGPRIVRVGTHATTGQSTTSLWARLMQHRGGKDGGGNHRGSVFRKEVGAALKKRYDIECSTWGKGSSTPRSARNGEVVLEQKVSEVIGAMSLLWLALEFEPEDREMRAYIERNAIALLSSYGQPALDPASDNWLGGWSDKPKIRKSGLWNSNYVDGSYSPEFLEVLEVAARR